jgi:ligand-binding SRPBCC domain-containing protein
MPTWSITTALTPPPAVVFAFFRHVNNRLQLTPPQWHSRLTAGPESLELGCRLVYQGRRWGVTQTLEVEVVELEEACLIIEEQRRGPFRRWRHSHHFEASSEGGTWLREEIDYLPPSGVLGQLLTTAFIERDLEELYRWRDPVLSGLLSDPGSWGQR